eukprot:7107884-Lingulodinium_polyedra.AAC.1
MFPARGPCSGVRVWALPFCGVWLDVPVAVLRRLLGRRPRCGLGVACPRSPRMHLALVRAG